LVDGLIVAWNGSEAPLTGNGIGKCFTVGAVRTPTERSAGYGDLFGTIGAIHCDEVRSAPGA